MYKILISNLKADCIIGVKPEERLTPQEVLVDLSLSLDLSKAVGSDDVRDTVDYDELSQSIVEFIEASEFKLLEKLAYETAKRAKSLSGADEVKIIVKKPLALKKADYTAVELSL